jgi:hypothetical protein
MPVAELQKRNEEFPGEPEYIPKLGRAVFVPWRHPGAEPGDQLIERRSRKPPIRLDRDHLPRSLQKAKQRNYIRPVCRFELGGAGRLASRPIQRREEVVTKAGLPIRQSRRPAAASDQAAVELQLAGRNALAHDRVREIGRHADARANRLQWRPCVERNGGMVLVDQRQQRLPRRVDRSHRVDAISDAPRA